MLFNDGDYTIYVLQHQDKSGRWIFSNLDYFGKNLDGETTFSEPWRSFSACGECWQTTGIRGSFDKEIAFRLLLPVSDLNPAHKFRIVEVHITQKVQALKEPH